MSLSDRAYDFESRLSGTIFKRPVFHDFAADKDEFLTASSPYLAKEVRQLDKSLKGLLALLLIRLNHLHDNVEQVGHVWRILKHLVFIFKHRQELGHGLQGGRPDPCLLVPKAVAKHGHEAGLVLFNLFLWQVVFAK